MVAVPYRLLRWPPNPVAKSYPLFHGPPATDALRGLATAFGWRFTDAADLYVSCGTLRKMPLTASLLLRCVPLAVWRGRAVVVVDDPLSGVYVEANPQILGPPYRREVEVVLTTPRVIDALLERRRRLVRA